MSDSVPATHLVVSCIDHRCTDDLAFFMRKYLSNLSSPGERYDHISLPGASLGPIQKLYPAWAEAFWQQAWAALQLHPTIEEVVVVDHLDCGAYKKIFWHVKGFEYEPNKRDQHYAITREFAAAVKERFPKLRVTRWLLEPCDPSKPAEKWKATPLDLRQAQPESITCEP